jgi:hypothetical protein
MKRKGKKAESVSSNNKLHEDSQKVQYGTLVRIETPYLPRAMTLSTTLTASKTSVPTDK